MQLGGISYAAAAPDGDFFFFLGPYHLLVEQF